MDKLLSGLKTEVVYWGSDSGDGLDGNTLIPVRIVYFSFCLGINCSFRYYISADGIGRYNVGPAKTGRFRYGFGQNVVALCQRR